jgi:XTP/dITP diphosphohydrolase
MNRRLLAATGNAGKLVELKRLLPTWEVLGFRDLAATGNDPTQWQPPPSEVDESGDTFLDNAIIKALHSSRFTDLPVVSDDSGLCVDCLDGRPGVHSARYGGPNLSDRERYELLLKELEGVPDFLRAASYRAVVVLARQGRVISIHEGAVSGRLLSSARGDGGFGYDPIFLIESLGKTMAEVTAEEKDAISHRARAVAGLAAALAQGVA